MAEELKHLIEQIQREGVEKAEQQAETIISQAKEKAAKIVSDAEKKAHESLLKAKSESDAFAERSVKTLEQAARDLLITVGQGCEKVVSEILGQEVEGTLSAGLLKELITGLTQQGSDDLTISVSSKDLKALTAHCTELARSSGRKIELISDAEILSGFTIGFREKNVYLDYSGEALSSALTAFLRPELAQSVSRVAAEQIAK